MIAQESTQVQRCRPFWLTEPCPAWCVEQHRSIDRAPYRRHYSEPVSIPLLLLDGVAGYERGEECEPAELELSLQQHVTEAAPRVRASLGSGSPLELTLGEAAAVISLLQRLVDQA